jgi:hypothetical protein
MERIKSTLAPDHIWNPRLESNSPHSP